MTDSVSYMGISIDDYMVLLRGFRGEGFFGWERHGITYRYHIINVGDITYYDGSMYLQLVTSTESYPIKILDVRCLVMADGRAHAVIELRHYSIHIPIAEVEQ